MHFQPRLLFCLFYLLFSYKTNSTLQAQIDHPGHSHNDYLQARPLHHALELNFKSIEVDIFPHKGKVVVAHFKFMLGKKPTLQELYLAPLQSIVEQNKGFVFPDSSQLILMIDLKKGNYFFLEQVHNLLMQYEHLLSIERGPNKRWGPIKIIFSGNYTLDIFKEERFNYASIDAAPRDWHRPEGIDYIPRASMSFKRLNAKDRKDQQSLETKVKEMKTMNRKARFYAAGNKEKTWAKLKAANVDWINVDNLEEFVEWYHSSE